LGAKRKHRKGFQMRAGVSLFFQNSEDWPRFLAGENGERTAGPHDAEKWIEDLRFGELADELGFDSLWTVEHHVTPYTMVPNPLQLLSYFAGRTKRLDMGTMVIVLPWHNPLRVAEDMTMLQYLLGDREMRLGLGRGAARREFNALGVDMNESRERFAEAVEVIRLALTEPSFSFRGKYYQYANVELRPRPRDPAAIIDSLYCAWGSPATAPTAGQLGLKPLLIPQKAWADYLGDMEAFARERAAIGLPGARPIVISWAYCHEDLATAAAFVEKHLPEYAETAFTHYEMAGDHFIKTKGYEHYAQLVADQAAKAGVAGEPIHPYADLTQIYVDQHVWGNPEQCLERVQLIVDTFHPEELAFVFKYGSISAEEAERSMRIFADKVLPAIHDIQLLPPILYEAAPASAG
jgi:alkanesulfonate monooxygenase SsuD/methylene tetrahydromethanopterin reductase-like flavin-dependent oxidoreductase (luciferase family)